MPATRPFTTGDTAGLGGPFGTLRTVLERTFLRIDVLAVEVRLDAVTAARIESVVRGAMRTIGDAEAIAAAALDAPGAWARLEFRRDVDVSRLVDEIRRSMRKVVDAGILSRVEFDSIAGGLEALYAPLAERGVLDGDVQLYRLRGDTLRTVFMGRDGRTYIDSQGTGRARRMALLGSWFVRGSDFRDGLIRSLQQGR